MTHAIRIHNHGGPEVLTWEPVVLADPGPGQVRVRHTAVGLNFIDTYHRSGLYPVPALPTGLGMEAAGIVEALGEGVDQLSVGDRTAYACQPLGAYSEARVMPAEKLVRLPDEVPDQTAAAVMLKGLTAHYLLRRTFPVKPGDIVLVHAAAGGVGLLLCQWACALGATVIGTVGDEPKARLAALHGCHHPIVYTRENFVEEVRTITCGKGVDVVYDGVGQAVFLPSLDCLRPLGMLVTFGNASGPAPAIEPALLSSKGSLFLTRPSLAHYTATRAELIAGAGELFEILRQGSVKVEIGQTYPLRDAAKAHGDLEARRTTGSSLLLP
jgi:NADPH:quinone reductase